MNATETRFSILLAARQDAGEIKGWRYEAMRLKWGTDPATGNAMRYLPDFCVIENDGSITLAEVKGRQIWSRDSVRFKGCRAEWPQFKFELWQYDRKTGWTRNK